jgi:alpha-ribazole phosphatase
MAVMTTSHIDLMRHGEPVGGKRFRGTTDDPLSDSGWQQMRTALGSDNHWDIVVSSPLRRCAEFASEVADKYSIDKKIFSGLAEMEFGEWEGMTPAEVEQAYPHALEQFYHDPFTFTAPGGESMQRFHERVSQTWKTVLTDYLGQNVLLIAHGGVNRVILQQILDFPPQNIFRIQMDFAAIVSIIVTDDGDRLWPRIKKISEGF